MVTRQTPAGDGSACPPCRSWQRCREKTRSPVSEASMVVAWTFAQPRGAADPQSSVAAEQTAPALATLSITYHFSGFRGAGGWRPCWFGQARLAPAAGGTAGCPRGPRPYPFTAGSPAVDRRTSWYRAPLREDGDVRTVTTMTLARPSLRAPEVDGWTVWGAGVTSQLNC